MTRRGTAVFLAVCLAPCAYLAGCGPGGGPGAVPPGLLAPVKPPPAPLAGIAINNPGIPGGAPVPPGGGALVFDEPTLQTIWTGRYNPDNPLPDQPPPAGFIP